MLTVSQRWCGVAGAALMILAGGCFSPAKDPPAIRLPERPVRIAAVKESTFTPGVTGTGTLGAKDELSLSFKVAGVIASVSVDAGDRVHRGQVLATLQRREIDAAVARAQSAEEKATRDVTRFERLYTDSVVTLVQLQDARTALSVARADLDATVFNQRYATIVAPAGGTVLARNANPGELISSGAPVLTLGSSARGAVVRVGLPDRDVVHVQVDNPAVVRFDAYPDKVFAGRVSEIAAAASAGTGTYAVEIALPHAETLPNGLVGRVVITPATAQPLNIVPLEAVIEADGVHGTVYILAGDWRHAQRRNVTIAFTDGRRVGIAAGLRGAQAVITEGAPYLDDGDAVRILP